MAIPASGPLALTDIQTEFGGSNPIGLNEYYAGGGLVQAGASGTYGAVPSSGQISIQNFYGTSAYTPIYIQEVFSANAYDGVNTTQTITNGVNVLGSGGMVWVKNRNGASGSSAYGGSYGQNMVFDTDRGMDLNNYSRALSPNLTYAQSNFGTGGVGANSNGFSVGRNGFNDINDGSGNTFVGWTFRKKSKFFDIVSYTGNGSATNNISHNLGSLPGFIIVKGTNSTDNWVVCNRYSDTNYFGGNGGSFDWRLNKTDAAGAGVDPVDRQITSTTINVTRLSGTVAGGFNAAAANVSGRTYIMYLFAHNAGGFGPTGTDNVISCGGWSGSNFAVTLGYQPQFMLYKNADSAENWIVVDSARGWPTNGSPSQQLNPNVAGTESGGFGPYPTSTGFYVQGTGGGTYSYIAIRKPQ